MASTWGANTWSSNSWGDDNNIVTLTGIGATTSLGDESIVVDVNPIPTGIEMTASQGTATEIIAVEVFPSGISFTANLGTADAAPDALVNGVTATTSVGSVEAYNLEGWGRYFYGQFEWGATGEWESVEVTGIAMSASLDSVTVTANSDVTLTGFAMTAAEGIVDPSPDATVVGIGMTASLAVGTVVVGEANVTVLGQGISMGLGVGTLDAVTLVDVTGISMSASINGVSTKGFANVSLTGIELTSTLNNANTLIWDEINTGSSAIWTEVPTRAA